MDFGDGLGWRLVNPSIVNDFSVVYPTKGQKSIAVGIFNDGSGLLKLSLSQFVVGNAETTPQPSSVIGLPGLKASVYKIAPLDCPRISSIKLLFS